MASSGVQVLHTRKSIKTGVRLHKNINVMPRSMKLKHDARQCYQQLWNIHFRFATLHLLPPYHSTNILHLADL